MTQGIVFTGGGTAGHVTPNLALIQVFQSEGWRVDYIGSKHGVEHQMLSDLNVSFYGVSSGKLRRYLSWQNVSDPFKILLGIYQSWRILHRIKPDVVFSKGGFVAVPVVIGAWLNRIPVIAHESDISPGLANKLCFPFVKKICLTFEAARRYFKNQNKIIVTGTPIREQLFKGNKKNALALCEFTEDKPCILVMGGSMGAQSINQAVREALPELCKQLQVIHLCGKGKVDLTLSGLAGYQQFEYADDTLADFFAASDMVISRSGANALYEILALAKPHILIPLSRKVSRGDQIQNARYFQQQGISHVIDDEALSATRLISAVKEVLGNKEGIVDVIKQLKITSATSKVIEVIKEESYVKSEKIA